jgi:hypothetical protein
MGEAVNERSKNQEMAKREKKAGTYRRVVAGNVNGSSVVQSDEQMEACQFKTIPGYEHTLIWINAGTPDLSKEQRLDRYPDSVVPGPGGTSLHFVAFPPASVFADPSFDGKAAQDEALIRLRGLADHFEREDPAMHKTNTVDYAVVYDGEVWLGSTSASLPSPTGNTASASINLRPRRHRQSRKRIRQALWPS